MIYTLCMRTAFHVCALMQQNAIKDKISHPFSVEMNAPRANFLRDNKLFGTHYTNVLWTTQ